MDAKIPINVPVDEKQAERIERQERSWGAVKLFVLGTVSLGLCLFALIVMSNCQLTPLPH